MSRSKSRVPQGRTLQLPPGVSLAEWSLEKLRWQNPRIRCLLGCVQLVEEVLESNFAILHCSPRRLREIWVNLNSVAATIRNELKPLMAGSSVIEALDEAVHETAARIGAIESTVLDDLAGVSQDPSPEELERLRSMVCVAVGKLHAFLLDSLGQILAADPRSREDTDYYLSRSFARDLDDAEWLHTSVWRLEQHLVRVNRFRDSSLTAVADFIQTELELPSPESWQSTRLFLKELVESLAPKLQRIIGLRGIRIDELEIVETSSVELPRQCGLILEVHELAMRARERAGPDAEDALRVLDLACADRLVELMQQLDGHLRDLTTFVPLWRSNLAHRRALSFRREESSVFAAEKDGDRR